MAFVEIRGASKSFRAQAGARSQALEPISLTIDEGEFVTIVGRSGCGKSTLLRMIAGLLEPSGGSIVVDGRDVCEQVPDVGFAFQAPVLLPWKNVLDNVLFSIEMLGQDRTAHVERAVDLLALAGLTGMERRFPSELSGGMQQRVAICRSLIHNPRLLLMDEPFGALDALTREEMAFHLLRLWELARTTIVFVTHSITEAILLADRVVVMATGPGRVIRDIRIPIERPRVPEHEFLEAFEGHARELRELLFEGREVRAAPAAAHA